MNPIIIKRPDDFHVHFRDGPYLKTTVPHTAATFARAVVMPNLSPAIINIEQALAYRKRILEHTPPDDFTPLMTLYLSPQTTPQTIQQAKEANIFAMKLYPAGATTHSDQGIHNIQACYPIFEAMQSVDLPLMIHGEVTDTAVDCFDREKVFIDRELRMLRETFPNLKICLEHITTQESVQFVQDNGPKTAATITAHHLLFNRNAIFEGGIRPDYYCLPLLKRNTDQQALIQAAIGDNPQFFLGTDSAPHEQNKKYSACGCAGIYTSFAALSFYAEVFERSGALDRLEAFSSIRGANFYELPLNEGTVTLSKTDWTVPKQFRFGDSLVTPLMGGETLGWTITKS